MVKRIKSIITLALFAMSMLLPQTASAQGVSIKELGGWFESGYITWAAVEGATTYNVYVKESSASSWTKLDSELVRKYPDYYRADAIGIKAGTYKFKVVPADANGEMTANATESESFTAAPHDRSGFAHVGMPNGIGAYKNDGTLKDNAKVIYVWADNAKTVSTDVITSSKGGKTTAKGLQDIIYLYQKGYDTTPLDIRIIGTIKAADMDRFDSSAEGLQVKGRNNYSEMPITIEGVGNDAAIHGFGILVRGCHDTEFRNFAIMLCMDDCLSLDTGNSNVWVHNMDLFYGNTGGDADQAKGDGTIDIKGQSMNVTVSYNHFYDSGKCSLGGMKGETTDCWMTYHHNWFDHSDSRHPRIRTAYYHIYNNYYDGNAKYGVGVTSGGSAFVENNYFRNCKYPMLISKQGTDAEGDGTFSGEPGGVIKAFNNYIAGAKKVQYYDGSQTNGKWDAVRVDSRDEAVNAVAFSGGTPYNSAADLAARTTYIESKIEEPNTVPATVKSELGAGRMNHGDFNWNFNNAVEDTNYAVIKPLKDALIAYKSTLVGFAGGNTISNGGADKPVNGGEAGNGDDNTPSWGEGDSADEGDSYEEEPYISSADGSDYYWFSKENETEINNWLADGTITLAKGTIEGSDNSYFNPTYAGNDTYPAEHIGSLQLAKATSAGNATSGGSCTFYCPNGVTAFELYTLRTGSTYYLVQTSTDGKNFTTKEKVEKAPSGIYEKDFSGSVSDTEGNPVWIRIVNTSTGGLNIQGVRINQIANDGRAASTLKLTSDAKVTIEKDATSQITAENIAEALTYKSSNTAVATVDENGLITAVGIGSAVITVTDPGNENVRGKKLTVNVTVTDNSQTGGEDNPDQPIIATEEVVCNFLEKKPSSSMVTVSGNYSDSKGETSYNGTSYGMCVKMESATTITIKPAFDCTVTLVFDAASKKIKIDGNTLTTDANSHYTFEGKANTTYTLTKGDTMNLFLVIFTPKETTAIHAAPAASTLTPTYNLSGVRVHPNAKGFIISNGVKKFNK